jgi:hypothetical protein
MELGGGVFAGLVNEMIDGKQTRHVLLKVVADVCRRPDPL